MLKHSRLLDEPGAPLIIMSIVYVRACDLSYVARRVHDEYEYKRVCVRHG